MISTLENVGVEKSIVWTRPKMKRFDKAIMEAIKDKKELFIFDGNSFVTTYAIYLLQYLKEEMK